MTRSDLTRREKYITNALDALGRPYGVSHSNLSASRYIVVSDEKFARLGEYRIRISDHELPPTYEFLNGFADIEIGSHPMACDRWFEAVFSICEKLSLRPPRGAVMARTRWRNKLAAEAARKKAWEEKSRLECEVRKAAWAKQIEKATAMAPELVSRLQEMEFRLTLPNIDIGGYGYFFAGKKRKNLKQKISELVGRIAAI